MNDCFVCVTREHLYSLAQVKNITGRKAMTKKELYRRIYGNVRLCEEHSDKPNEIWKFIEYASNYEISNMGRLRNIDTFYIHKGSKDEEGYLRYLIRRDDNKKIFTLSQRLIANAFVDNPYNYFYVDHINRIRDDNVATNLRWVPLDVNNSNRKVSENIGARRQIYQLDLKENIVRKWNSITEAANYYKINRTGIGAVLSGKRPTAAGFKWAYLEEEDDENEIWKDIPIDAKFEYQVSNKGRVKNLKTNKITNGTLSNGYHRTQIKLKNETRLNKSIHSLILLSFKGTNPEGKDVINHKNGIKTCNSLENLEYTTKRENSDHAIEHGLNRNAKAIGQYNKDGELLKTYRSISEAVRVSTISFYQITKSRNSGQPCKNGYIWKLL